MKKVHIKLLQTCMIAGLPRSPAEGIREVDEAEGKRLVAAGMAEMAKVVAATNKADKPEKASLPEPVKAAVEAAATKGYSVTEKGGGWHHITGPGIADDDPVSVQGDDNLIAKLTELASGAEQG